MILQKLLWFQMGGGVSDRQWNDVQNMLKIQANQIDHAYLTHWAKHIGVDTLLNRAIATAHPLTEKDNPEAAGR